MKLRAIFLALAVTTTCGMLMADDIDLKISTDTALNGVSVKNNSGTTQMRVRGDGNVGIGTANPENSAILDLTSTNKGFLPPRMTYEEKWAIASPVEGMIVYQTDAPSGIYIYMNSDWQKLDIGVIPGISTVTASSPLFSTGGTSPNLSIQSATGSRNGYLTSSDWTNFTGKISYDDFNFAEISYNHGNGTYSQSGGVYSYAN